VTGIAEATGDWLVVIPADLPLDLDGLSRYWEAARHADVVVGVRSDRGDVSWFRRAVSVVNIRLIRLLFRARQRQFTFISLYRLDVLREIDIEYWRSGFFFAEIILKATALGRRVVEVEVRYLPRQGGKATGARWPFVLRTGRDLCRFWLRWWWRGPQTASRRPAA
jgi:glycosyltransferase involved in cell wall biosynthesis